VTQYHIMTVTYRIDGGSIWTYGICYNRAELFAVLRDMRQNSVSVYRIDVSRNGQTVREWKG
jgi:hypothetical protein